MSWRTPLESEKLENQPFFSEFEKANTSKTDLQVSPDVFLAYYEWLTHQKFEMFTVQVGHSSKSNTKILPPGFGLQYKAIMVTPLNRVLHE